MSTKNLARTVIEGGRYRGNAERRRSSNGHERTAARQTSTLLRDRLDADAVVYAPRTPVRRSFDDKLGAANRWLGAQVGRPWNKVRSELFARFDARTTAGRHILFDHLLQSVEHEPSRFPLHHELFVDLHGLLRKRAPRSRRVVREPLKESAEQIDAWLAARSVATRDEAFYWCVLTRTGHFRQDQALTAQEAERWQALPDWYRARLRETWARPVVPEIRV
jgi:hypothetical protein